MSTYQIDISGMHCESCVGKINATVNRISGAHCLNVNLPGGKAKIEMNENSADIGDIVDAINTAGFSVTGFRPINEA